MNNVQDLDLREWFAGQALAGLLGGPHSPPLQPGTNQQHHADRVARMAYEFADAMLRLRAQQKAMATQTP